MPDYIYLLENRLSADQQHALRQMREAAREAGMILFLTGDAVRDLTSGHAVRDLEIAVHGNALKLKKIVERLGGRIWGEDEVSRSLYLCFAGTVRLDVVSTHRTEYPKPGKPVIHPASIQEDLRRRDFTANAMAISLNEGSFGLLMDPMNGAADIEARTLRLVSNYGFLEEPSLTIRATRYLARLGWELDPRTRQRYENAREEGVIEHLSETARSRELEQIGHEDAGLKVLQALETEGWMKVLFPAWTAAMADEEKLTALHDLSVELLLQGVHADMSAAQMQLLTAKLAPKDLATLKKMMLRPGFVEEWNGLDAQAAAFAKVLLAKENQVPSAAYKLFTSYNPEAVLWLGFSSRETAVRERYNLFLKVWPEARQRIPYAQMQEMRITPELAGYQEIAHQIFLALIDGKLTTVEEIKAFLEPHSPPAPPPQPTYKRSRAKRGAEAKAKDRSFDDDEEEGDENLDADDLDDMGRDDEDEIGVKLPKARMEAGFEEDREPEEDDSSDDDVEDEPKPAPVKKPAHPVAKPEKQPAGAKPAPAAVVPAVKQPVAPVKPKKVAAKAVPAAKPKPAPARVPAKKVAVPAKPAAKAASAKPAKPAPRAVAKPAPAKAVPAKKTAAPSKPAAKKAAPKPAPKKAPAKGGKKR